MNEINLAALTNDGQVRNLSGHDRGEDARQKFDLDVLDQQEGEIKVVVPEDIYLLSPSFIQGMFAKSIKSLGGRQQFLNHYEFVASTLVMKQIDNGITASLIDRGPLVN